MANGLTYQEIEAFSRMRLMPLSAWEVGVIRRIDAAVVSIMNQKISKPSKPTSDSDGLPPEDTRGIAAMLDALVDRKG